MSATATSSPKSSSKQKGKSSDSRFQQKYDFKDEQVVALLKSLIKVKKIKLSESMRSEEMSRMNDPNYCAYHRMVCHPTSKCYILKDKIQALLDACIFTLQS